MHKQISFLLVIAFCHLSTNLLSQNRKIALPTPRIVETESVSLAEQVAENYLRCAFERYENSLAAVRALMSDLDRFLESPSPESHHEAKQSWIQAHTIYSHCEVFRFGNPNVDEWETRVNAWPIDEGFLDYVSLNHYVADEGNPHALKNLIATNFQINDNFIIEARREEDPKAGVAIGITDIETNVITGFHTIEFLLWGQDLNRTPTSAGERPYTDYVSGPNATGGNTERRALFLKTVASILERDLVDIIQEWDPSKNELYVRDFRALPVEERLHRMILGMGSLGYGELAGERIQVALLASDQEEEQNCFSDTTHLAILHNALSIETLYRGDKNGDSNVALSDLIKKIDPDLDEQLLNQFEQTRLKAEEISNLAENGEPFDLLIQSENESGRSHLNKLIDCLREQTVSIEKIQKLIPELAKL